MTVSRWAQSFVDVGRPTSPMSRGGSAAQQSNGSLPVASRPSGAARAATVNWTFVIVFDVTQSPKQCMPFVVPAGCVVRGRANNGGAGNAAAVYVDTDRNSLLRGLGTPLAPLDDVAFPVDNTGRIWAMGNLGDGLVISVLSQQKQ